VRHDDARLAVAVEGFQNMEEPGIVSVLFGWNAIAVKTLVFVLGCLDTIAPGFIGERRITQC